MAYLVRTTLQILSLSSAAKLMHISLFGNVSLFLFWPAFLRQPLVGVPICQLSHFWLQELWGFELKMGNLHFCGLGCVNVKTRGFSLWSLVPQRSSTSAWPRQCLCRNWATKYQDSSSFLLLFLFFWLVLLPARSCRRTVEDSNAQEQKQGNYTVSQPSHSL